MTRRIPRWLARAPIPLFRHGVGRLFGARMMMLEHVGRHTGQPRYTVLEVLDHRPGVLILVSGYGARSQWYLNIRAQPAVRIWTGRIRGRPAQATVLPDDEARRRLDSYRRQHRHGAAILGRMLAIPELTTSRPLPADICTRLPLVQVAYEDH